jgi:carbonic anhydrase/acetyltransferase-like protein (isoleucine patch superfamily)
MPTILPYNDIHPIIHPSCFIAEDVVITGDVHIGEESSVWFKTVIRGDVCPIRIGKQVNIQDLSMVHGTFQKSETIIGDYVSIGHGAIIHGCQIADNVLIGMGAIVMDNAIIEEKVIVGAGAVVLENAKLESGYLYGGTPAKKIKKLDPGKIDYYIHATAMAYVHFSAQYK